MRTDGLCLVQDHRLHSAELLSDVLYFGNDAGLGPGCRATERINVYHHD